MIHRHPGAVAHHRVEDILRLAADADVDPALVSAAAWRLLQAVGRFPDSTDGETLAAWLERDEPARGLLREDIVAWLEAERALTVLRRHLLMARA